MPFIKTHFSSTGHFQKTQKSTTRSVTNWDFGNVLGHEDSRKERESCVWNVLCFLHNTARWQKFLKISHFTQEELRRSRNSIKKRFPHLFMIFYFFKKNPQHQILFYKLSKQEMALAMIQGYNEIRFCVVSNVIQFHTFLSLRLPKGWRLIESDFSSSSSSSFSFSFSFSSFRWPLKSRIAMCQISYKCIRMG